jgi:hypothetical protein
MTKAQSNCKHTQRRAYERYGLELSRRDIDEIVDKIQSNNGKFIRKDSRTRTLWRICHKTVDMLVVYDKRTKTLVTALTNHGR